VYFSGFSIHLHIYFCASTILYLIKTVWYWHKKDRLIEQNRESRNKPHVDGQLVYDKGAKNVQRGKDSFLSSDIGKIGQPHAKELRLDYYFKPYTKVKVD